jgi:hypothetical protein
VAGNLRIPLLGDENRNGKTKSIREGFYVANHHQIVAVHGVYSGLPASLQAIWRSVYSAFFGYLFGFCFL